MQKLALLAIILVSATHLFSQLSISGSFNATGPGLYYTLGGEYTSFHHRFGGGLNINQGYAAGTDAGTPWQLKPDAPNEYFGLNLNYNYVFYPKNSEIEPFVFFDLNYQYCSNRNGSSYGNIVTYDPNGIPFNTFTETIGVGFTTDIYKNFYLIMKGGVGFAHQNTFDNFNFDSRSFNYKASIGFGYRFSDWQRTK